MSVDDEVVRGNEAAAKLKMKSRADKRTRAKTTTLNEGDIVLVRRQKTGKLSTPLDPTPLVVTSRKGTMVTARRADGSRVTRNGSMFRSLPYEALQSDVEGDFDDDSVSESTLPTGNNDFPEAPVKIVEPRRSSRLRKPPQRLPEWAGINGGQTVDKRWTNDGQPMDKRRES